MLTARTTVIAVAATLIAAVPASAQQQQPSQTDQTANSDGEVNAANEILCRRQPAPTGTRIGTRRICKTRMEWDRLQRESRDELEDAQRTPLVGN